MIRQRLMEFMKKRKRLSLLLLTVATLGTVFVSYAINRTTTKPTYNGGSVHTFPANLGADEVLQGFDGTSSGTLPDSFPPIQLADNSQVRQGPGGTGFGNEPTPTQPADNSDDDSTAAQATKGGDVGQGSDSTNPEAYSDPDDGSPPTLLAGNRYLVYDRDLQTNPGLQTNSDGSASTQPAENSETSSPAHGEPLSHVPEPSAMLLLSSGFIGLAALRRKLRKS